MFKYAKKFLVEFLFYEHFYFISTYRGSTTDKVLKLMYNKYKCSVLIIFQFCKIAYNILLYI